MRNILFFFLCLALCSNVFAQSAETRAKFYGQPSPPKTADTSPRVPELPPFSPDFSIDLAWNSRNMREGWTRCDGPTGTLQAEFSESGAYLGFWGAYDFTDRVNRKWRFQDTRFYAGFSMDFINAGTLGPVTVDLSWTYNHYLDHTTDDNGEIGLTLALNQLIQKDRWLAGAAISVNHNYDDEETWLDLAGRVIFPLDDDARKSIVTTLHLYWGDTAKLQGLTNHDVDGNAFYATVLQTEFEWKLTAHLRLAPYLAFSYAPDRRARHAAQTDPMNSAGILWAGIHLVWQF
ncbi:MAG: hypothetical protein IKS83_01715 [Victivallales bacterium]|nr:hypothetical protein [Victivallales bacterium]